MISIMETIGKPIVSLLNGKQLGIVCNIEIKKNKVNNLIVLNDEIDSIEYVFVPAQNIYFFGGEAITIKSHSKIIESSENNCPKILGATAISQEGEKKFVVQDAVFDEKTFNLVNLIGHDNKAYSANIIATIENSFIILKGKIKLAKPRNSQSSKMHLTKAEGKNSEIKINPQSLMTAANEEKNKVKAAPSTPSKIVGDYAFLVGRRLTQNLIVKNGKTLITAGETLNSKNLSQAISSGNLNFVLKNNSPVF